MIELANVSRWYGPVIGMNDVTCTIGPGVTALLGQNGAGKSTMMRIITGQIRPTTGSVKVEGMDPFANPDVCRVLGYCPDLDSFPEHLSGRQFVDRMGAMMGIPADARKAKAEELLTELDMKDRSVKPLRGYSKGMRQRVKLAAALIHDPKILLLDEPLNGLDPVGRREFMDVLARLAEKGKTIIVSSHILFEVEQMTSSILLMHRGRLLASGNLRTIRDLIDAHPHRIRLVCGKARKAAAALAQLPEVVGMALGPGADELEIRTTNPSLACEEIARLALEEDLQLIQMETPDDSLEAVFGYLVETR